MLQDAVQRRYFCGLSLSSVGLLRATGAITAIEQVAYGQLRSYLFY